MIVSKWRFAWLGWLVVLVLMSGLTSQCTPPEPNKLLFINNFEQVDSLAPHVENIAPALLSREQAYSWLQSAKLDADHRTAMLTGRTWQFLGEPRHVRVRLRAWLPSGRPAAAVLTVMAQRPNPGGEPIVLRKQQLLLDEVVRHYRTWIPTTMFMSLTSGMQPTDEIVVTIWGRNIGDHDSIYFDDVSIEDAD